LFGLKRVSAALCLFLITAAAASAQTSAGARSPDLIEVTAGVIDGSSVRTMNPAALFFLPESRLSVGLDYRDRLSLETDYSLGLESYVSQPSLSYNLNYSGGGWSLTAYSDYCFEKRGIVGEALMLDVLRTNGIEFGASYGIGSLALGLDVRASKKSYANQRLVSRTGNLLTVGTDLLQEVFTADYVPAGEESLELGAGLMFDIGILTLGAYSGRVVDFFDDEDSGITLCFDEIISGLDIGMSIATDPYTGYGRLRLVQLLAAADVTALGSSSLRRFSTEVEALLALANRLSFAVSLGYSQPVPAFDWETVTSSADDGTVRAGVSADLVFMNVRTDLSVPNALFHTYITEGGLSSNSELNQVTGSLTFGFFL
jgi:hypothetical protein